MAKGSTAVVAFNRGLVSRLGLARIDLKRSAFSSETQTNWVSRVLGSMMLRPGLAYLGGIAGDTTKLVPFIFATDDLAIIELTNLIMRVWINDVLINRPAVTSAVTNGGFDTNLTSWTLSSANVTWNAISAAQIASDGTTVEYLYQTVSVPAGSLNIEHALRIFIARGPVTLRVGSTVGGDEYIAETQLGTGVHSLAFTPTGSFTVKFQSTLNRVVLIDSVQVEGAGTMILQSPYFGSNLKDVRFDQSADVIFVACKGYQQRRIERRASRSWSFVLYQPEDGPFRTENFSATTITPSALSGNITLTASVPLFHAGQVGALFRVTSDGQAVTANLSAANTFSGPIEVTNVGEARRFTIVRAGVWVGTLTLQRSIGAIGSWEDVESYTTNDTTTYADELDNQIVFYRIGFKIAAYTSGTANVTLNFPLGSITGVARVTDFTSTTAVNAEVLKALGGTTATVIWAEGKWSDYRGWPSCVLFHEGRLWWAGRNGLVGSVSDAFDSFDPDTVGDSGPIDRTIGSGPVDTISWLLSLQRLLMGTQGAECAVKSTAFDEPLTPTNMNIKTSTNQGSTSVAAVKLDGRGIFIQRSARRVYELVYDVQINDYSATDLTAMVPDIGDPGIVALAIQRQPDTRIHCVRSDGVVALATIDHAENVLSWQLVETDGLVKDVVVLPGDAEDQVYYAVQRQTGASGVSFLSVTSAGTGYLTAPTLVFTGGGGANALGTCSLAPVSLTINAAGAGYTAGDVLTVPGGTLDPLVPVALTITVLTVDGGGAVLTATTGGSGVYKTPPSNPVGVTGGTGLNATFTILWGLDIAYVINNGGGYTSPPTVGLVTNAGTGGAISALITTSSGTSVYLEKWAKESECVGSTLNKQADAFIEYAGTSTITSGGFISGLAVIPGAGYTALPAISISGGGGSGATASITLQFVIYGTAMTLGNLGSGYTKGDVLTMAGGTFTRPATFLVTFADSFGGRASGLELIDGGSYTVLPAPNFFFLPLTGGTGHGVTIEVAWGLGAAAITNPGFGYFEPPLVTITALPLAPGLFSIVGRVTASVTVDSTTVAVTTQKIGGLSHLEGKEVVVWGDGKDLSPTDPETNVQTTYTVRGGTVSLDTPVAQAIVGLPYNGDWKSSKLAYIADNGETALCEIKQIKQVAFVMADVHSRGVRFGPSFDTLENLPDMQNEQLVGYDWVYRAYDYEPQEFPGDSSADARLCLRAQAPRPVTLMGAVIVMKEKGKS